MRLHSWLNSLYIYIYFFIILLLYTCFYLVVTERNRACILLFCERENGGSERRYDEHKLCTPGPGLKSSFAGSTNTLFVIQHRRDKKKCTFMYPIKNKRTFTLILSLDLCAVHIILPLLGGKIRLLGRWGSKVPASCWKSLNPDSGLVHQCSFLGFAKQVF